MDLGHNCAFFKGHCICESKFQRYKIGIYKIKRSISNLRLFIVYRIKTISENNSLKKNVKTLISFDYEFLSNFEDVFAEETAFNHKL